MDNNSIAYLELLGVTMAGVHRPDQGLYWTDLVGWWGLPDVRGEADDIPGGHGRFPRVRFYREARAVTLTGHILTKSNAELVAVRDRLEAALSVSSGVMRVVTSGSGAWERAVEIDTLDIEPDHGKRYVKFTVDMIAPDPRRYGPEQVVGPVSLPVSVGGVNLPQRMPWNFGKATQESRIAIINDGAINVHPLIEVSGGFNRVSVVDTFTGQRLTLDWQVPEGSTVTFDTGSRRARLDGSDVTRWMTRRQWFEIPPGETHEIRFEAISAVGDPQMQARFKIGAW